jgi:AcrR family transcriptional regulator
MSPRPNIDHIRRPQILAADMPRLVITSAVLYWFNSKEELLAEALTWEDDIFYSELTERLAGDHSPPERLAMLIEAASMGGGWTLWMELWARALRDAGTAKAREEADVRWREAIESVVQDGRETGDFKDVDPKEVALTLSGLLDGLAVQVTLGDPEVTAERMLELGRGMAERLVSCELPESPKQSLAPAQAGA